MDVATLNQHESNTLSSVRQRDVILDNFFNIPWCPSADPTIPSLFKQYTISIVWKLFNMSCSGSS
jgi:hypothetical protein